MDLRTKDLHLFTQYLLPCASTFPQKCFVRGFAADRLEIKSRMFPSGQKRGVHSFCLCATYLEAQKQSVVRQSLGPVLYLDILVVCVPYSKMYFSTSLCPSLDKAT